MGGSGRGGGTWDGEGWAEGRGGVFYFSPWTRIRRTNILNSLSKP